MRRLVRAFLLALQFAPFAARGQQAPPLDSASVRRWREDLAFLRAEMPAHHASLFHDMTRVQFDSALTSIADRLPLLARHQVIVELQRLDALVGDGHSSVGPWRDSMIGFHTLPVALYWFDDGIYIRATAAADSALLGARVLEVGAVPVSSAIERLRPLISRDNEMGVRARAPEFLVMPELLHAVGLAPDPSHVRMVVETRQGRRSVVLTGTALFPMLTGDIDRSWMPRSGWRDARDGTPVPLWLSDPLNGYWFRYLPGDRTLYCQVNTIQQKSTDSLRTFMDRAIATADSAHADRFVLDLRLNGGGDGTWNRDILLPLIKSRYDATDRLFVITGRRTFSAAQMLVSELGKYTNATFVGEPTASHPNHYGDSYRIVLPNSRVTVRVASLYWQYGDPRDKRTMLQPALRAPLTFADYVAGRDPAMEEILTRKHE